MNHPSTPETLEALWRRSLEIALEAGVAPVLCLGWDALHPDSARPLLALGRLSQQPGGIAQPWIVAGGEGGLWLLAALSGPLVEPQSRAGEAGPLFGGDDAATFVASLNAAPGPRRPSTHLAPGMAWMLTPTALPGAGRSELEFLPFALADDLFTPQVETSPPTGPRPGPTLEQWASLLLLLALLAGALFV